MRVMVLSGSKLEERDIVNDLEPMYEIVGGHIETPMISVKFRDNGIVPIVNDEGKFIDSLKPEIAICKRNGLILDVVVGNVIFAAFDGIEDFTSLTDRQIRIIKNELKQFGIVGDKPVRILWMD